MIGRWSNYVKYYKRNIYSKIALHIFVTPLVIALQLTRWALVVAW